MAQTVIRGTQILNNTVQRQDLDTSTVGQAVVTKIVQGSGITLSSTGADSGTGDVTVSASGPATDAPNDANTYGRHAAAWSAALPLTGGTVTGPLTVVPPAGQGPVCLTLTGNPTDGWAQQYFNKASGTTGVGCAIVTTVNGSPNYRWALSIGDNTVEGGSNTGSDFKLEAYSDAGASLGVAIKILRANLAATFGGPVTLAADPASALGAATKQYVDNKAGTPAFVTKTAAYTLTAADSGKYFICSGGSWALTLPAPVAGFNYRLRNDMGITGTTGTITLSPSGGTIDGLASLALLPQQECTLFTDGTNWRTHGLKREVILGTQDITSATAGGTILLPVGYRHFELQFTGFLPVTNDDSLACQFSTNGGSTWIAGSYYYGILYNSSSTAAAFANNENVTSVSIIPSSYGGITTGASQAKVVVWPGSAAQWPSFESDAGSRRSTPVQTKWQTYGILGATGVINALKYFTSSGGNIAALFLTVKGVV